MFNRDIKVYVYPSKPDQNSTLKTAQNLTIQKRIKALAGFDITDVNSIEAAKFCTMPALFIHSINDTLVRPEHANELF